MSMKIFLIHGEILWVSGDRVCMLRTITVAIVENMIKTIVKSRNFTINGTTKLVGGDISKTRRKNTVRAISIDMLRDIFSLLSAGR